MRSLLLAAPSTSKHRHRLGDGARGLLIGTALGLVLWAVIIYGVSVMFRLL